MQTGRDWTVLSDDGKNVAPPAATWYDEMQQCFVTLLDRPNDTDVVGNLEDGQNADVEVVRLQILSIPLEVERDSLIPSPLISVPLPKPLASGIARDGSTARRIPLMAKFSLDGKLLALQYTPTMLRIVPIVEMEKYADGRVKHWTIDLSDDVNPICCSHEALPRPFARRRPLDILELGLGSFHTKILPGGIIWSDHGGNSQDLTVVTDTCLICYKISLMRNHMASTHTYPHPPAAGVWFEPMTRALLVGSYVSTTGASVENRREMPRVLAMRPFFLRFPEENSSKNSKKTIQFPRLELPPPERVQTFVIGTKRHSDNKQSHPAVAANISVRDVFLVNLYETVYCVEVGCLGNGRGIDFHVVDRKSGFSSCTTFKVPESFSSRRVDRKSLSVSVVDSVLCIVCRETNTALYIDVGDADDDSSACTRCIIVPKRESEETDRIVFHQRTSMLHPSFLLDSEGHGKLYALRLDLDVLSCHYPNDSRIIHFLFRRRPPELVQTVVTKRLAQLLNEAKPATKMVRSYARSIVKEVPRNLECETPVSVVFRSALLRPDAEFCWASTLESNEFTLNLTCSLQKTSSLTWLLEDLLIPLARKAIADADSEKLEVLSRMAIELVQATKKQVFPNIGLITFAVSVLWRLGHASEAMVLVKRFKVMLDVVVFEQQSQASIQKAVQRALNLFVESVLSIADHVEFGSCTIRREILNRSTAIAARNEIVDAAVRLINSSSSYDLAAQLLRRGRLVDAIGMCSNCAQRHAYRVHSDGYPNPPVALRGEDFFRAAIRRAIEYKDIGDRCRLFYHVYTFLKMWDPACLDVKHQSSSTPIRRGNSFTNLQFIDADRRVASKRLETRPSGIALNTILDSIEQSESAMESLFVTSAARGQSRLAHNFPYFPYSLFGEQRSPACLKVREMFGFPQ